MQWIWSWLKRSWKAVMPLVVAALWAIGAQFIDALAQTYDGQQLWIASGLSSLAVWFKKNAQ